MAVELTLPIFCHRPDAKLHLRCRFLQRLSSWSHGGRTHSANPRSQTRRQPSSPLSFLTTSVFVAVGLTLLIFSHRPDAKLQLRCHFLQRLSSWSHGSRTHSANPRTQTRRQPSSPLSFLTTSVFVAVGLTLLIFSHRPDAKLQLRCRFLQRLSSWSHGGRTHSANLLSQTRRQASSALSFLTTAVFVVAWR